MAVEMPSVTLSPGQSLHGFTVEAVTPLPEIRCVAYRLAHARSGARLLHLHADDPENLFAVGFRTPPPDDTGLPHILEHTVLCGSRKYPVKDPFVELLKTSLATFLNAMTYPDKTVYPCASMNRKDFFNLASVYCDAVFHPRISEEHFKQEGHHLDFETPGDPASPLVIKGIVYNEMKGAFSDLDGTIGYHTRLIFPDNAYGRVSGGDPEAIPALTYAQFVAFHRTYYHPSNAFIFIYGDIPTAAHLAFLDGEGLRGFERIAIDTSIAPQPRWTRPQRFTCPYPAAPDDRPTNKSAVVLEFFTNPATDQLRALAMHVVDHYLLANAASPLRKALIDSGLGEELTPSGYGDYQRDTTFSVGLKGTAPERTDAIAALVFETCRREAERGFDPAKVAAAFHQLELDSSDIPTMYPLHLMGQAYDSWIYDEDPVALLQPVRSLGELRERCAAEPRFLERTLLEQIVLNPHHGVFTFVPDAGLSARRAAAAAAALAARKAALPPAALARIAVEAAQLEELQDAPNPPEALATLPALRLSDVSPEPMRLDTDVRTVAGRPLLDTRVFTNGLSHIRVAVDVSGLDDELLDLLPLYAEAIRKMGAAGDDYVRMAEREAECSGGIGTSVAAEGRFDDPDHVQPFLFIGSRALDSRLDRMLSVLADRLVRPDFTDRERLRQIVLQNRVQRHANLVPAGNRYAAAYAARGLSRNAALGERLGGLTQVRFVDRLAAGLDARLDGLVERLEALRGQILARGRLVAGAVATDAGRKRIADWYGELLAGLPPGAPPPEPTTAPAAAPARTGIALPADVAFVARAFRAVPASHPAAPALMVLEQALSYGFLWNEVRAKRGAYGCRAAYSQSSGLFSFASYRDPFVRETLETYGAVCGHVARDMDLSPAAVEQAIIGSLKALDQPIRPGAAGAIAMGRFLSGVTEDNRRGFRRRLLALGADDLRRAAGEILAPAIAGSPVCVVAGRAMLEAANAELPKEERLAIEEL